MPSSRVMVNGTEVSVEDSGKTVVNISITQESGLAYVVKAVARAGQKWAKGKESAPKIPEPSTASPSSARALCNGEQKVLGAVQILLGFMCLGLGGVLCLLYSYVPAIRSGEPFWMGSLFILSGFLSVLSERRGGCWVLLATFFNLGSVVAGCVGLAVGMADVGYMPYWNNVCEQQDYYPSWRTTQIPVDNWRVDECNRRMRNLMNIFRGVQILLLIFAVAALGIALFCFGYGLYILCCSLRANSEEYVAIQDSEVPPSYEEPEKEKMAV